MTRPRRCVALLLGVLAPLLVGCKRGLYDIRQLELWRYNFVRLVESNPISPLERRRVEGFFYLLGGQERPLSDNPKVKLTAREIKVAWHEGTTPPQGLVQYTSGVLLNPQHQYRVLWGVLPENGGFAFFPFPEDPGALDRPFVVEIPLVTGAFRRLLPGAPTINVQVRPHQPTVDEVAKDAMLGKGRVFRFIASADLPLKAERLGEFALRGGTVKVEGELVLDRRKGRLLRRHERQHIEIDIHSGYEGVNLGDVYRKGVRQLDAIL